MISPDAANLGVKAVYVWAGLLVPTVALLYLYYPEVSDSDTESLSAADNLQTYGRTYWELDELYERKIPAWRFKKTQTLSEQSGYKEKGATPRPSKVVGMAES